MANSLSLIFRNTCLMPPVISWAAAQAIKVLLNLIIKHKIDATRFIGAGGMPSAHSAFVCCLAFSCGLNYGFDSAYFAISAALAIIVMYDAAGVRRAAGKQAAKINTIIRQLVENKNFDFNDTGKQLKELLGHTPLEVFAGACLGTLMAFLFAL